MEISKVRIPSGTILNIKDTTARTRLSELSNVENKNVATIKNEILTSANVKSALGTGTDNGTFLAKDGTWKAPSGDSNVLSDWNETDSTSDAYINNKPTSLPASDVSAWAKASTKPSYNYSEINYNPTEITSAGGAVSINGTNSLLVITISAAVSGITFSAIPENGHSCHLIITAASALSVAIAHGATMFTGYTSVCPEATDISLNITAGGYIELDLLRVGTKIYVRGV